MRKLFVVFAGLVALVLPFLAVPIWAAEIVPAAVVQVHDGDTLRARLLSGEELAVRLAGIDAPELAQPWGRQARDLLAELVGQEVGVEVQSHDRYGRAVAVLFDGQGREINLMMIEAGLAWWYWRYSPLCQPCKLAEERAKAARRGLWSDEHPIAPWAWRKGQR